MFPIPPESRPLRLRRLSRILSLLCPLSKEEIDQLDLNETKRQRLKRLRELFTPTAKRQRENAEESKEATVVIETSGNDGNNLVTSTHSPWMVVDQQNESIETTTNSTELDKQKTIHSTANKQITIDSASSWIDTESTNDDESIKHSFASNCLKQSSHHHNGGIPRHVSQLLESLSPLAAQAVRADVFERRIERERQWKIQHATTKRDEASLTTSKESDTHQIHMTLPIKPLTFHGSSSQWDRMTHESQQFLTSLSHHPFSRMTGEQTYSFVPSRRRNIQMEFNSSESLHGLWNAKTRREKVREYSYPSEAQHGLEQLPSASLDAALIAFEIS